MAGCGDIGQPLPIGCGWLHPAPPVSGVPGNHPVG